MRVLYTSDALDSKRHTSEDRSSSEFEQTVQRLRTDTLCRILFGQSIFVPQGWSIDSIPFLTVLHELETAIRELKGNKRYVERLSPFVAELKSGAENWHSVFQQYLGRKDCIWSGIPILKEAPDRQQYLFERFKELNRRSIFDRDLFCQAVEDTLEDRHIARGWHSAFRYFSTNQENRTKVSASTPGVYSNVVVEVLKFTKSVNSLDINVDPGTAERLCAFSDQIVSLNTVSDSVSTIMELAKRELDENCLKVVDSVSTFAQIFSASAENGAMFASPAYLDHIETHDGISDKLVRSVYRAMNRGMTSFYARRISDQGLADHYISLDWVNVWKSVLAVTLTAQWENYLQDLHEALLSNDTKKRSDVIKAMDKLLESEVDSLTLYSSGANNLSTRINIRLTKKATGVLSKIADKGIVSGVGAGTAQVGTLMLETSIPGATLIGALFAQLIEPAIPDAAKRTLNPFNQKGLLSSRTSILSPFKAS